MHFFVDYNVLEVVMTRGCTWKGATPTSEHFPGHINRIDFDLVPVRIKEPIYTINKIYIHIHTFV